MTDPMQKNYEDYNRKIEQIRNYADLTDEAKRRMMGEEYAAASRRHEDLAAQHRTQQEKRITDLEQGMFGMYYPADATSGADRERIRQSYRDAFFRVSGMGAEALGEALEKAERRGDGQLARAVYHEATERGIRNVADSYLASRPRERERWNAYAKEREEAQRNPIDTFFANPGPQKPAELRGSPSGAAVDGRG